MNGMGVVNGYGLNAAQNRLDMLERQRGGNGYDYYDMNDGRNMGNMNNAASPNMGGMGMMGNRSMGMGNQVQMQMFKGRPVANFYEANASLIDMDGTLHMFPDFANKRIYTKRINLDGVSEVKTYELVDNPIEELNNNGNGQNVNADSIGRNEFESYMKVIGERFDNIIMQLSGINNVIMGGATNAGTGNGRNDAAIPTDYATVPSGTESPSNDTANIGEQSVIPEGTANGKRKNGR